MGSQPYFKPRDGGLISAVPKTVYNVPIQTFPHMAHPSIDTPLWFIKTTPLYPAFMLQTGKNKSVLELPKTNKEAAPVECCRETRCRQLSIHVPADDSAPRNEAPSLYQVCICFGSAWPLQVLVICHLPFSCTITKGQ